MRCTEPVDAIDDHDLFRPRIREPPAVGRPSGERAFAERDAQIGGKHVGDDDLGRVVPSTRRRSVARPATRPGSPHTLRVNVKRRSRLRSVRIVKSSVHLGARDAVGAWQNEGRAIGRPVDQTRRGGRDASNRPKRENSLALRRRRRRHTCLMLVAKTKPSTVADQRGLSCSPAEQPSDPDAALVSDQQIAEGTRTRSRVRDDT